MTWKRTRELPGKLIVLVLLLGVLSASVFAASKPISGYVNHSNSTAAEGASVIVYVNQSSVSQANPCYTNPTVTAGNDGSYSTNLNNLKRNDNGNDCSGLWATGDTIWAQADGSVAVQPSGNGTSSATTINSGTGLQTLATITLASTTPSNGTSDSTPPNVTLLTPANNTINTNSSMVFTYNVTDNSSISNCSIVFDSQINATSTSITANAANSFVNSKLISQLYNWSINCTDASKNTGRSSTFVLNVSKIGSLAVTLVNPAADTLVTQMQFFNFSVQVNCSGGRCGQVNVSLDPISNDLINDDPASNYPASNAPTTYNEADGSPFSFFSPFWTSLKQFFRSLLRGEGITGLAAGSLVPTSQATPFWTNSSNPTNGTNVTCLTDLREGNNCNVTWTVNASGAVSTVRQFFAYANSTTYTNMTNESARINLTIGELVHPSVPDVVPPAGLAFNFSSTVTLAANVTDNVAVSRVFANITYPNATIKALELSLESGSRYALAWTVPFLTGTYNISFVANDTSYNVNATQTTNLTVQAVCAVLTEDATLDRDILSNGSNCLTIGAHSLAINCRGYSITYGNSSAIGYGLNSAGYDNLQIQNCTISQSGSAANSYGIFLNGTQNSTFTNVTINGAGTTSPNIFLQNSQGNRFVNVIMIPNATYAILDNGIGEDTLIYNNSFGQINWTLTNMTTNISLQLGSTIFIENNKVGLTNDAQALNLDGPAQIEIRSLSYSATPLLLKDGTRCDDSNACNITYASGSGTLFASINSFSNYSTSPSSTPSSSSSSSNISSPETGGAPAITKKAVLPIPTPLPSELTKEGGLSIAVTEISSQSAEPAIPSNGTALVGEAIRQEEPIQKSNIVQTQGITVRLRNDGSTMVVLRPSVLPQEPIGTSQFLRKEKQLQRLQREFQGFAPEEQERKIEEMLYVMQFLEKEGVKLLLGKTAGFFFREEEASFGLVPTGKQVSGRILLPVLKNAEEITLAPGESIEKTLQITTFGINPQQLVLRFTSLEGTQIDQQVTTIPKPVIGTAVDYNEEEGIMDMYVTMPPASKQRPAETVYWVEYSLNSLKTLDKDIPATTTISSDLFGPYYVPQGESLFLAQQFALEGVLPPEELQLQAKIYQGHTLVAEHHFPLAIAAARAQLSSETIALAGMAVLPSLLKAVAQQRSWQILLFIMISIIIFTIASLGWVLIARELHSRWQLLLGPSPRTIVSGTLRGIPVALINNGSPRILEAWAFLITPQQFLSKQYLPPLAITPRWQVYLQEGEKNGRILPLPIPQGLPAGRYFIGIYAQRPATGEYHLQFEVVTIVPVNRVL